VLEQIDRFLEDYGYLSEVATDIAVPRWQENPHAVREMFTQFLLNPQTDPSSPANRPSSWKIRSVQQRLDLKGAVTEVYSRLLAELRYTILVLEQRWLAADWLTTSGDIFFLEIDEIRQLVGDGTDILAQQFRQRIAARRSQFEQDNQLTTVPNLVYGNDPPLFVTARPAATTSQMLQGIAASPGQVEGRVKVVRSLQSLPQIDADTLLVVPYTDAGWAPLLARASGVIADVGGRLSHGAIVAREYGIPAVMNVADATSRLQDGQWIRLDGSQGIIEVLGEPSPSADE
jgi:pyruvate,water dikinase